MAGDYLPIMASSVSSERVFSSAGITISKRRSRLKADVVEALQCLKCMLRHELIFREPAPCSAIKTSLDDEAESEILFGMTFYLRMTNKQQNNLTTMNSNTTAIVRSSQRSIKLPAKPGPEPSQAWAKPKPWKWAGLEVLQSPSPHKPSPSPGFWAKPGPAHHYSCKTTLWGGQALTQSECIC